MPEDYFTGDDGNDQNDTGQSEIQELRNRAKAAGDLEKQLKAQGKELEELRKLRASTEAEKRLGSAQTFGLSPAQAGIFLKAHEGEVTQEAVAEFQQQMGLTPPKDTPVFGKDDEPDQEQTPSFAPVSVGGTGPNRPQLTYEQYVELRDNDIHAAMKAVAEDRVQGLYHNPEVTLT